MIEKLNIEIQSLVDQLLELPTKILESKLSILELSSDIESTEKLSEQTISKIKIQIQSEVDEFSRKVYGNTDARSAELSVRMNEDLELLELNRKIRDTKKEIEKLKISIDFFQNTQTNLKSILSILSA